MRQVRRITAAETAEIRDCRQRGEALKLIARKFGLLRLCAVSFVHGDVAAT